jgi:hypothetical protein
MELLTRHEKLSYHIPCEAYIRNPLTNNATKNSVPGLLWRTLMTIDASVWKLATDVEMTKMNAESLMKSKDGLQNIQL